MKIRAKLKTGLFLLLWAGAAGAQVYKWVDAKGMSHYSDMPPPPSAGKVKVKSIASTALAPQLPQELADAMQSRPVTLYTTSQCEACDQGRALLQARGIPHAEKTVNSAADHSVLKQAGSVGQLPLLLVGRSKQIGFEAGAWNAALTDAAYPAQRMLPPDYQNPPAAAAAPPAAAKPAAAAQALSEKPQPLDAPRGFQF